MQKLLIGICLLIFSLNSFAQKPGTPDYLLVKRGFSIFKLGDPIEKHIKYFKLNTYYDNDEESSIYKAIDPNLVPSEKGVKIKDIELRVHNGLIESIDIFVDGKYKAVLLSTLKTHYGITKGTESAFWASQDAQILLSYVNSYKETDMGRAIFLHTNLK